MLQPAIGAQAITHRCLLIEAWSTAAVRELAIRMRMRPEAAGKAAWCVAFDQHRARSEDNAAPALPASIK